MNKLNKAFFTFLIIVAVVPVVVQMVWAFFLQQPLMTLLWIGVALLVLGLFQRGSIWSILRGIGVVIVTPIGWLISGFNSGGRFMPWYQRWRFMNPQNKGLVVDGRNRLSAKHSYQNLVAIGGVGLGKTSNLIFPNLLMPRETSFVVVDLSGEIRTQSSGYLQQAGYEIQTIDLMDFGRGLGVNPLLGIQTSTEVAQAAHVLIKSSGLSEGTDVFWSTAAEKLLRIIIQVLVDLDDEHYLTLSNVKYLLNVFGQKGFNELVVYSSLRNEQNYQEYLGFVSGNEKTISSILTTAQTALAGLTPELAKMTAINQIDMKRLRERKVALFLCVKQQDISQYAFFLNLFFTRLCHTLLSDLNTSKQGLSVDLLLDEFGQFEIPNFEVFAATSRKYSVSFALMLQSLSQLELRYGRHQAQTILDSIGTEIYFPGMSVELASQLSRRMGKSQGYQQQNPTSLMREDQLIHMKDDEALLLHSNKAPIKLKLKPYYKQRVLRKRSELEPAPRVTNTFPDVHDVPLDIGSRRMAQAMPEATNEDPEITEESSDNPQPSPNEPEPPTTNDTPASEVPHADG